MSSTIDHIILRQPYDPPASGRQKTSWTHDVRTDDSWRRLWIAWVILSGLGLSTQSAGITLAVGIALILIRLGDDLCELRYGETYDESGQRRGWVYRIFRPRFCHSSAVDEAVEMAHAQGRRISADEVIRLGSSDLAWANRTTGQH